MISSKIDVIVIFYILTKMKLSDINDDMQTTYYENPCYKVFGLSFFNSNTKDNFIEEFNSLLL